METDQELETFRMGDLEKVISLKITFLVENTTYTSKLLAEHGLSILCEGETSSGMKFKYLFDTGPSKIALTNNIKALDINFRDLDAIILSHGHYDHTGGLESLLGLDFEKKVDIICHPDALQRKFARAKDKLRSIGLPFDMNLLKPNAKIKYVIFTIDDTFIFWDATPPYEWTIQGRFYPLIGRHTLKVYAYSESNDMHIDQMDIIFLTFSYQYGKW